MELLEVAVMIVWLVVVFLGTKKFTEHLHKARWIEEGRIDARLGMRRFDADVRWIQRYYDMGYDAVINEKEDANA